MTTIAKKRHVLLAGIAMGVLAWAGVAAPGLAYADSVTAWDILSGADSAAVQDSQAEPESVPGFVTERVQPEANQDEPTVLSAQSMDAAKSYTYTIVFAKNGATGGYMSNYVLKFGKAFIVPYCTYTRPGYTFKYWRFNYMGSMIDTRPGTLFRSGVPCASGSVITFNAMWSANTYKLYYHANGGTGAPSTSTYTTNAGKMLSLLKPKRTGYVFNGWSTSRYASSGYSAGSWVTFNTGRDVTLYATWKRK